MRRFRNVVSKFSVLCLVVVSSFFCLLVLKLPAPSMAAWCLQKLSSLASTHPSLHCVLNPPSIGAHPLLCQAAFACLVYTRYRHPQRVSFGTVCFGVLLCCCVAVVVGRVVVWLCCVVVLLCGCVVVLLCWHCAAARIHCCCATVGGWRRPFIRSMAVGSEWASGRVGVGGHFE